MVGNRLVAAVIAFAGNLVLSSRLHTLIIIRSFSDGTRCDECGRTDNRTRTLSDEYVLLVCRDESSIELVSHDTVRSLHALL